MKQLTLKITDLDNAISSEIEVQKLSDLNSSMLLNLHNLVNVLCSIDNDGVMSYEHNRIVEVVFMYDERIGIITVSATYEKLSGIYEYGISAIEYMLHMVIRETCDIIEGSFNVFDGRWIREPKALEYVNCADKNNATFGYCPKFDEVTNMYKRYDGVELCITSNVHHAREKYFKEQLL